MTASVSARSHKLFGECKSVNFFIHQTICAAEGAKMFLLKTLKLILPPTLGEGGGGGLRIYSKGEANYESFTLLR